MKIFEVTSTNSADKSKRMRVQSAKNAPCRGAFGAVCVVESESFKEKKETAKLIGRLVCVLSVVTALIYFRRLKKAGKSNLPAKC